MNNQDIELRLQNIVNSDALVSKQLAIKTKRIYAKLHFLGKMKEFFFFSSKSNIHCIQFLQEMRPIQRIK